MLRSLLAIISNTFTETLRQGVYGVVVAATLLLLVFSPSLAMFTLDDDNQLLKDIGLSTLLVAGLFLATFGAATVVIDEIENKTVLTVISKTVSRSVFVVGKFVGIAGAVLLGQYFLSLVLLMVVRHGVMQTGSDSPDRVVVTLGIAGTVLTVAVGLAGNYFYHWRFSSTGIVVGAGVATIMLGMLALVDPNWRYNPSGNHLDTNLIGPLMLTATATVILTAIAVAVSTHLGRVMTLGVCALVFMVGAVVQYWLGPLAGADAGVSSSVAWALLAIFPSLNFYVATNAIYADQAIPYSYVAQTALYAVFYVTGVLLFAIALFRRRQMS